MKYGISKKSNTLVSFNANTSDSRYPAKAYMVFRKFKTRAAARAAKQAYTHPQDYCIISLADGMVVR